jgi:hypothetical protein
MTYAEEVRAVARLRETFVTEFGVREQAWSPHNLSRFLRLTGERPERVAEMRAILGWLGLGSNSASCGGWLNMDGVFDHGEMWGRGGRPLMLVGHPYNIYTEQRGLLAELGCFGGLRVNVDDRPSHYGFGTHHVRVELVEARRPYAVPPSTRKTQVVARQFRRALEEESLPVRKTRRW